MEDRPPTALIAIYRIIAVADVPTLVAGLLAAAAGKTWGAYVLVAYVGVRLGSHLVVGAFMYHDIMNRPWPTVPPADCDDD